MGYLITGSKGFIGRNLTASLLTNNIPFSLIEDGLEAVSSTDSIIHLSASTNVRVSVSNPIISFEKNCFETFKLLSYLRRINPQRFIFTSSAGASNPLSPYLASKAACEAYCKAFRNSYGMEVCIARLSNVYGPCSEFKNSVIAKFIRASIAGKPFYIFGDGNQERDFIYVDDVVKSLLSTTAPLSTISSGKTITINSLLNKLTILSQEFFNYTPKLTNTAPLPGEITNIQGSEGISDPTDLDLGLRKTYEWFAENN